MNEPCSPDDRSPAQRIDARIAELGDWRGEILSRMRALIHEAEPHVVEEWKWRGTPVWSCDGIVCTGESYKAVVKLTFAQGAALNDPSGLFNASLDGNVRRAIDIHEGERIDVQAFKALIRAAVDFNRASKAGKASRSKATRTSKPAARTTATSSTSRSDVVLLSGGNPQIAKGDGDVPVQAYIAAMPGWKRDLGQRLDALLVAAVPGSLRKAVRWNSPFYGVEGQGWFASFHVMTHYVKLTFFQGLLLKPLPPGGTERSGESRWIDIREHDVLDEAQLIAWIRQAAALPGWTP